MGMLPSGTSMRREGRRDLTRKTPTWRREARIWRKYNGHNEAEDHEQGKHLECRERRLKKARSLIRGMTASGAITIMTYDFAS